MNSSLLENLINSCNAETSVFLDQLEDLNTFNNLENTMTIYHHSIPNVKLAYPEPFIASASFMHSDL